MLRRIDTPGGRWWIDDQVAAPLGLAGDGAVRVFVDGLVAGFASGATFKRDGRSWVQRVTVGGLSWVVKRYQLPRWRAWAAVALKASPAWREQRGAALLHVAGRRVNRPMMLLHDRRWGAGSEVIVLPFVEGVTLDQLLTDDGSTPPPTPERTHTRRKIAEAVGRQIGWMSGAGLINRDHKPTNLVLDRDAQHGQAEPVIIDTAGVQRRRDEAQVWSMLAVMHRAARRVGAVSLRERVACVRTVLAADGALLAGESDRLRAAWKLLTRMEHARPLSYDPVTKKPL